MQMEDVDDLATIMLDSYDETAEYARSFFVEHDWPLTVLAKAQMFRSIVQGHVVKEDRFDLRDEYASMGRVLVTDTALSTELLIRSESALRIEQEQSEPTLDLDVRRKPSAVRLLAVGAAGWLVFIVFIDIPKFWYVVPAVILSIASAIFWAAYFMVSLEDYTNTRRITENCGEGVSRRIDMSAIESLRISPSQARFFLDMIDPISGRIERITESVEQHTRAVSVSTAMTISVSPTYRDRFYVLPALLQRRGELVDDLRIYDTKGSRISTLPQHISISYAAAVMRKFVMQAGNKAYNEYCRRIEPEVVAMLSAGWPIGIDEVGVITGEILQLEAA